MNSRKTSQEGAVEDKVGGAGKKDQAPISPGEGFNCFLEESIAILDGSEVQEAASSDFQQIGQ